jgi:hypothetical protein
MRQHRPRNRRAGEQGALPKKKMIVPERAPEYSNKSVFLNIPYDDRFRRLYLAYITGLVHLDLDPRATIEIPGGRNRLDKILDLIRSCRYSIHDLSRVELDRNPPCTPRFNMPFELGLAVATAKLDSTPHDWFVFESVHRRASKSLSDLGGTDPNIHHGTVEGVMRELCNSFIRIGRPERYSVPEMMKTYRAVAKVVEEFRRVTGARSLFEASVFRRICFAAVRAAGIRETR